MSPTLSSSPSSKKATSAARIDHPPLESYAELADFLVKPLDPSVSNAISGNAPRSLKELAAKWAWLPRNGIGSFGNDLCRDGELVIKSVDVQGHADDSEMKEVCMVMEMDTVVGMHNKDGNVHNTCLFFLVDETTAQVLHLKRVIDGARGYADDMAYSQTINVVYHSNDVPIGTRLTVISRSLGTEGEGIGTAKSEIWDKAKHRLICSAMQSLSEPGRSTAKL